MPKIDQQTVMTPRLAAHDRFLRPFASCRRRSSCTGLSRLFWHRAAVVCEPREVKLIEGIRTTECNYQTQPTKMFLPGSWFFAVGILYDPPVICTSLYDLSSYLR